MKSKILLVDDDVELVELLAELLTLEGFQIDVANNGLQAIEKLDFGYDLILLDIMMPELNGIDTLRVIRANYDTPVIMLTARGDDIDRILGLELGADDYIPKPFNDRELIARIKAILRRTKVQLDHKSSGSSSMLKNELEFCGLVLYPSCAQAYYEGVNLNLTGTEFSLLLKLVLNPGVILSREALSLEILGKSLTPFERSIDMHMSNLRKKLPVRENDRLWFKTLRGRGYLLVKEPE
ncbi:response regulator [[Haemophilus] felis]|uniref:DNA-binding response regulator n=1 Tax=[Haemophilus] felis TaxID=123822 RepID=A0A1T0BBC0_9PAST|nr:response regulator [[Haemophilus] felis]NBI41177.1 response regulator [[Haemophilus] felis]OOS07520.1 DNA-binding response regulator [[Haemophilus] felis]